MVTCILVGIGGFIGTVCRYLIGLIPVKEGTLFPIKTFLINLAGAFVISLITALAVRHKAWDPRVILMLKVGVCGGFTTFSTFAFESAGLLQDGHALLAFLYAAGSVILGIAAIYAAQWLVH